MPVVGDRCGVVLAPLRLVAEQVLLEWVALAHLSHLPLQGGLAGAVAQASGQAHSVGQRRQVFRIDLQRLGVVACGGGAVAIAHRQHALVVPGPGEAWVHLQGHRQMRAGAVEIAVDHQLGAAVVVVVGEGAAVGDRLRPAPVHQHAAVQVDAAAAAVHAHAGVDVADVVQRIAVLVPAQHAAYFLDLSLQPDVARHRHEQQGEGQAVDVARGVALGDAVGGLGVVLQVQAVGIEGQRHQLLQTVFGIGAAVDALLQQRMQRRWKLHDLLRDRNGGCRGSRRRNRRCRLSLDGRCRVR
ncbi:hypothetical protein NB706_002801 [Xanthomonas sacchari]|nr:hypothetical protein [Xanthomonas sacchari]